MGEGVVTVVFYIWIFFGGYNILIGNRRLRKFCSYLEFSFLVLLIFCLESSLLSKYVLCLKFLVNDLLDSMLHLDFWNV